MARTKEEKEIAHQRRKVKEAEAKMDMHMAKAAHAEDKLMTKQSHYHVTHAWSARASTSASTNAYTGSNACHGTWLRA